MFYITFRSITYAQRAQRLLGNQGIRSYLYRTPKAMAKGGCGYSLRTNTADAVTALQQAQLPYLQVFTMEDDQPREWTP